MRRRLGQCLVAAAALLIGTAAASAEEGFARVATNLRAGPDADYPVITGVGPGEPVFVYGCLSDYSWCDVRARRARGWMQASRIELVYAGRRVLVQSYAPRIGVPVVRFDIGTYWDRNYRNYDWYEDRGRYDRRYVGRPDYRRPDYDRPYDYGGRDPRPDRYDRNDDTRIERLPPHPPGTPPSQLEELARRGQPPIRQLPQAQPVPQIQQAPPVSVERRTFPAPQSAPESNLDALARRGAQPQQAPSSQQRRCNPLTRENCD